MRLTCYLPCIFVGTDVRPVIYTHSWGNLQAQMDPYNPKERLQKRWKYMPHFLSKDLGKLWDLWDLQGTYRTFYLGSATCFESTADVHSYNMQLADYFQL